MSARWVTFLIVLYITLELGSPFIAGAFTFNLDESVDGISAHRQRVKNSH